MLKFIVRGSKGDEYEIIAEKSQTSLRISCTCAAGMQGTWCGHRLALIGGDTSSLLSGSEEDMKSLREMLTGTLLERRYALICQLEQDKSTIDLKLKAERKALGREMNGSAIS